MLSSNRESKKIQTDQACMNNAVMYDYYSDGKSSSDHDACEWHEDDNTIDGKMRKLAKKKGYKLEESEDESNYFERDSPLFLPVHLCWIIIVLSNFFVFDVHHFLFFSSCESSVINFCQRYIGFGAVHSIDNIAFLF